MSEGNNNNKDCDECQKTLKDHLTKCADYGKLPSLVEKCDKLPGGCTLPTPESCPAPPAPPPKLEESPPKCNTPTTTFVCPDSSCQPPTKEECLPKPPSCPPPPTKVEQCLPKPDGQPPKTGPSNSFCGGGGNDNSCETRPLTMDK